MTTQQSGLVVTIWLTCGAIIFFGLVFTLVWALHPYSITLSLNQWAMLLFFVVPYLIVACAAARLRNRGIILTLIFVITTLCGLAASALRFDEMVHGLRFAQAASEGRRLMSCGPTSIFFIVMLEYSLFFPLTVAFGLLAMILGPKQEPQTPPTIPKGDELLTPGAPSEDVRIQADIRRIRGQHWGRWDQGDKGEFKSD